MCAAVYEQRHLVKATEVIAGLAESNGSLLPGLWRDSLHVTCGLTACTPGSAPGPTLGNEYGKKTLCTSTSIQVRRAGQQGPIRTLTAALKRSIKQLLGIYSITEVKYYK